MMRVGSRDIPMKDVNAAVKNVVKMLKEAEANEPRYDSASRQRVRAISWDSLQRTLKRNGVTGSEKQAYEQAYRTLLGGAVRGRVTDRVLKTRFIKVNSRQWRSLEKKLKGYFKTHNKSTVRTLEAKEQKKVGKTGQSILKGLERINHRDFKKVQGEKEQAELTNNIFDVLFSYSGVARRGRVSRGDIDRYFRGRGRSKSAAFKRATYAVFDYLSQAMRHRSWGGQWNRNRSMPRGTMCIDERRRAFRKIMSLKPGGRTFKAMERALPASARGR